MKKPLVSVLMVTYNRAEFLKESIKSVLDQTYDNIQFVIIDDGSDDESCQIIEAFQDDRIELYRLNENRHICYATNYGYSKIKGEYLARIDSDEVWYPNRLSEQLKFMEEHEEYKICFSAVDIIDRYGKNINDEEKDLVKLYETQFSSQEEYLRYFFSKGNCLAQTSVLMKTEVMKRIGDFNPSYVQLHDFEYWVRIVKQYPIYVINKHLLAVRRFSEQDKMENNSSSLNLKNHIRFYNEFVDIRRHFFDDMTEELFVRTFRDEFQYKDASTKEELECEKAFLLCKPVSGSSKLSPAGMEYLFKILLNKEMREVLENKYQFTEKTMYGLTGESVYADFIVENQLHQLQAKNIEVQQLNQKIAELHQLNKEKEQQIALYSGSLSWKITEPLRKISRAMRKK